MRVLVCGGRDYKDRAAVFRDLDAAIRVHHSLVVIQGGASGADFFAKLWAIANEGLGAIQVEERARWRDLSHPGAVIRTGKYGRYDALAGHRRNVKMLTDHRPDEVHAFPGGAGTTDMVELAWRAGVRVRCPEGDLWLPEGLRGRFER